MRFKQLDPTFDVITPLGDGTAIFLYHDDFQIYWGVRQNATSESWWWLNSQIRYKPSITDGNYTASEIDLSDDMKEALAPHMLRYRR